MEMEKKKKKKKMEMGGGSAKAIKKKKTALPWKCSHLGGGEDGKKRGSRNSGMGTLGGGPGRRAHTGQRTLSPLCWEGFLEQRSCRQAENRSYLGKIRAREQGQRVRRLVSGRKRGSLE